MKTFCAVRTCWNHRVPSCEVGFVDFPSGNQKELAVWIILTQVRHVVAGVTRVCTEHFAPGDIRPNPEWESKYPGQVNPNAKIRDGARPVVDVPGNLHDPRLEASSSEEDTQPMFARDTSARPVRLPGRYRDSRVPAFSVPEEPPSPPRRGRGRREVIRRGRGRPRKEDLLRLRPPPPADPTDPAVRARLVAEAFADYEFRQEKAVERGRWVAPDGTETLYISLPEHIDVTQRRQRIIDRRDKRGRGRGGLVLGRQLTRPEVEEAEVEEDGLVSKGEEESAANGGRFPPDTSKKFQEIFSRQKELQLLIKKLSSLRVQTSAHQPDSNRNTLTVLRQLEAAPEMDLSELDLYSTPSNLSLALEQLHQLRLHSLRLHSELLKALIRERENHAASAKMSSLGACAPSSSQQHASKSDASKMNKWSSLSVRRAIGLRTLCSRRAYNFVKNVLAVPLPRLEMLRVASIANPETWRLYEEMEATLRIRAFKRAIQQDGALKKLTRTGKGILETPSGEDSDCSNIGDDPGTAVQDLDSYIILAPDPDANSNHSFVLQDEAAQEPGQNPNTEFHAQVKTEQMNLCEDVVVNSTEEYLVLNSSANANVLLNQTDNVLLDDAMQVTTSTADQFLALSPSGARTAPHASAVDTDVPLVMNLTDGGRPDRFLVLMENGEVEMRAEPSDPPIRPAIPQSRHVRSARTHQSTGLVSRHPVSNQQLFKVAVKGADGSVLVSQATDMEGVEVLVTPDHWVASTQVDFESGQS